MSKYMDITKETQYSISLDYVKNQGQEKLGLMTNQSWHDDPKRLAFTFSRYKFVAKMMSGYLNVLEVGCGDAFASRIVQQEVSNLTVTDFDKIFVNDIKSRNLNTKWKFKDCFVHNFIKENLNTMDVFDGIYLLDVLEHIKPIDEHIFLTNIINSLSTYGTFIVGMPSLESQVYASEISKAGHCNCKTMPELKLLMQKFFHNVYLFSMNDEVLHTGYHKMAQYLFALCCNKK